MVIKYIGLYRQCPEDSRLQELWPELLKRFENIRSLGFVMAQKKNPRFCWLPLLYKHTCFGLPFKAFAYHFLVEA